MIENHSSPIYSNNPKRQSQYLKFLARFEKEGITINEISRFGYRLMQRARLHAHFFQNNSLKNCAIYLCFHALRLKHEYFNRAYLRLQITKTQAEKIFRLFERRIAERIPVEYITQEATYLDRKFFVNENVLVPRSIMSSRFEDFLAQTKWENYRVLDLCTGSGCIGISLALMNEKIHVDLVDISKKALRVAETNIQKYNLQNRVQCIQSNLFDNVKHKYDLIITNPPYVSSAEYKKCKAEFKNEPHIALESGWDGLDLTHDILANAKKHLNPNGKLIAEIGFSASRRLKRRYPKINFKWYKYRNAKGKVPMFAMDGIFECTHGQLPDDFMKFKANNFMYKLIDKVRDIF